jgi:hypothetical protein
MRARNFRRRAGSGRAGALDKEDENMANIPRPGKRLIKFMVCSIPNRSIGQPPTAAAKASPKRPPALLGKKKLI